MSVEFRPMVAEDLDWVSETEQNIYSFPWSHRNFADSLSAGYSSWVMCVDGEHVAYAVLMIVVDEAHLLNISVVPVRQGLGFGARLLDHLCAVGLGFGATQMFLEVRSSNENGLHLYDKWGFVRIGRRKGYYPTAEGREDAIVMRRALTVARGKGRDEH
jgi:ribosomal-protein-alanine N-acetyltransferase